MKNGGIPATKCPNTKKWLATVEDVKSYKQNKYSRDLSKHNGELIFDKSKGFHSVGEAAKVLGVPAQKIYYAVRLGCLPQCKNETKRSLISRVFGAQISCDSVRPNAL
jgi:hypothetical protein